MLVISSVSLDVVKVPLMVRFQSGSISVDVFPDTASVVEAFVEVSLPVPVQIVKAGDLVSAEDMHFVFYDLEPERLEKSGSKTAPVDCIQL